MRTYDFCEVEGGLHGVVGGRDVQDGDGVREEGNGVGNANGVRFGDANFPTTIVSHGGTNNVAVGTVCGPRAAVPGFVMRDNFHSWGRERGSIVVKHAVEL